MIDVVTVGAGGGSIAWICPEGTLKVGPQSAGADPGPMCYGRGGDRADDHRRAPRCSAGSRRTCSAARCRSTSTWPRGGVDGPGRASSGCPGEQAATGILEISAWNQANALRQITVKRGLDVRDFHLVTFGGSGSLLACRLVDILGLRRRRGAAQPGQPVGVRAAHRRRPQRLRADRGRRGTSRLDLGGAAAGRRRPDRARPTQALAREGFAERRPRSSSAAPTCATSGRPTRCGSTCPTGRSTADARRARGRRVPRRAPAALRLRLPRRRRGRRSSGSTSGSPASARSASRSCARSRRVAAQAPARDRASAGVTSTTGSTRRRLRPGQARRRRRRRSDRRCSRSSRRRCPCTQASAPTVDRFGNLVRDRSGEGAAIEPDARSTRSSSRSSRATWRRSRWRSRRRSAARRARR